MRSKETGPARVGWSDVRGQPGIPPAKPVPAGPAYMSAAVLTGLLAGLGGVAFLLLQKLLLGRIVFMGRHAVWMAPLAEALVCLAVALPLWVLSRVRPALRSHGVAYGVPAAIGMLAVLFLYPPLHVAAALALATGVGIQTGRWANSRPALARRVAQTGAVVLGAVVAAAGAGTAAFARFGAGPAVTASTGSPNILLLILDTVRASSLSVYGHEEPTTPNLERLAATGVLFERATASAPWTLPSHASMFTGLSPERLSTDWRRPLDDTEPTLAEYLRSRGYRTAGFVANMGYAGWESGLDRGFGHYRDNPVSARQILVSSVLIRRVLGATWFRDWVGSDENFVRKTAADVNDEFLGWLDDRAVDAPFFAFLNYYDAHAPYMPPEPFRSRFSRGRARGGISPLHRWNSDPFEPLPSAHIIAQEQDAYEGAIASLDDQLGALFRELMARGILDRTLVIVTSDHGEEFGEHGVYDHGNSLYLDNLHVPLIVRYPPLLSAPRRVASTVSLTGLPRMVVRLAGLEQGAPFPDARLADAVTAQHPTASPALAEVTYATGLPDWFPVSRGDMATVVTERWQYIRNGDGTEELYDLTQAADARRNAVGDAAVARVLAELRSELSAWRAVRLTGR